MSTSTTARLQSGMAQPSARALAGALCTAPVAYCRCRKSSRARLSSMHAVHNSLSKAPQRASGLCLHLPFCKPAQSATNTNTTASPFEESAGYTWLSTAQVNST